MREYYTNQNNHRVFKKASYIILSIVASLVVEYVGNYYIGKEIGVSHIVEKPSLEKNISD